VKRCADFRLQPAIIIPKAFCGQALPGPARGVYSTPPDSLAGCKVYIYIGVGTREGEGKTEEGQTGGQRAKEKRNGKVEKV